MVAAKQQFLLVHCAVVVCSDDDIGTHAGKRKMAAVLPALCDGLSSDIIIRTHNDRAMNKQELLLCSNHWRRAPLVLC